MNLPRGTLVMVELDPAIGHEQRGMRPCLIVSDSEITTSQRYPLICVVPITGTPGQGILYPRLAPGSGGLVKESFALIDQIRSIDKTRVRRLIGEISADELARIDEGLEAFLGLG